MKFRFRRSIRLAPGVKLNVGKKSASMSVGPHGAKLTVGTKGLTATAGIPGSGAFLSLHHGLGGAQPTGKRDIPEHLRALVTQRPPYWEFLLLQTTLADELGDTLAAWEASTVECMNIPTYCRWGIEHVNRLTAIFSALIQTLEEDSVIAIGAPGEPGNPDKILEVVQSVLQLLEQVTDWEQEVVVYSEHPVFGTLAEKMSGMSRPFMDTILEFKRQLDEQLATVAVTKSIQICFQMKSLPHVDEHTAALKSLYQQTFEEGGFEGDLFQTEFRVRRGEESLGRFSRRTVKENLVAGLFRMDDTYWSENRLEWRSLRALQSDEDVASDADTTGEGFRPDAAGGNVTS